MKIIFITAKPSYMPDPEELGTWKPMQVDEGFYMQTLGDYHLSVHECLSDLSSDTNNVKLKVEKTRTRCFVAKDDSFLCTTAMGRNL